MKIKILERKEKLLRIEIEEEGHTFGNFLQNLLLQNNEVEIAGYNQIHPLIEKINIYLITKENTSPEEILIRATERGKRISEEFIYLFTKEIANKTNSFI